MDRGYFKHHRKMVDWPWRNKPAYFSIWCFLLENASWKDRGNIFDGRRITLKQGQLITGKYEIASQTGVPASTVQRVLKCFESELQIEQKAGVKSRLITILNWRMYQSDEPNNELQMNHKRTTDELQVNTNKEVKKLRSKEKPLKPIGVEDQVWKDFNQLRKAKKAPLTITAFNRINSEAKKANMELNDVLTLCCERGWQGFKAEWMERNTSKGKSWEEI